MSRQEYRRDDLGIERYFVTGLEMAWRCALGAYVADRLAGDYDSPRALIDAEGWPLLSEVAGRVMFIVLNRPLATPQRSSLRSTYDFVE